MWSVEGQPLEANSSLLTHVLDSFYGTPDGFDFEFGAPPIIPRGKEPSPFTKSNIEQRASDYVALAAERAKSYPTQHVMIPYGGDFNFQNAHKKYRDFDLLIEEINSHPELYNGTRIFYSTLDDYVKAVSRDVQQDQFKTWTADFLPNAFPSNWGAEHEDENDSYWTGFYSSRPFTKALSRASDAVLHAAEALYAFAVMLRPSQPAEIETKDEAKLRAMRDAQAVFQHHDAISGTENQHVTDDYVARLQRGTAGALEIVNSAIPSLLNATAGPDLELQSKASSSADERVVAVFNPLGWMRTQACSVSIAHDMEATVVDDKGREVPSQIVSRFELDGRSNDGQETLWFVASQIPAFGIRSYTIRLMPKTHATLARQHRDANFTGSGTARKSRFTAIENEHLNLRFSSDGMISSAMLKGLDESGGGVSLKQAYFSYLPYDAKGEQTSGAYIFRPRSGLPVDLGMPAHVSVISGHVVSEVRTEWRVDESNAESQPIRQVIRLYHGLPEMDGSIVEVETSVGPISTEHGGPVSEGREIATRFTTNISSDGLFFTDANGLDSMPRRRLDNGRPGDADDGVKRAGNVYPVTSFCYVRDNAAQLTVLTNQPHGASSPVDGSVELMLHRRLLRDDERGVDEALNDTSVAHAKTWLLLASPASSARAHRYSTPSLQRPLQVVSMHASKRPLGSFSALSRPLPSNVHVVTLQDARSVSPALAECPPDDGVSGRCGCASMLVRLMNPFQLGEDTDLSQEASVELSDLFDESLFSVSSMQEWSITLSKAIGGVRRRGRDGSNSFAITLGPLQMRAFVLFGKSPALQTELAQPFGVFV
eukprot:TRINITY_DN45715_c0_g1_i1.p1 TRINITY_DN45715_c0_g1~~TRINITY_DN45715_c0_g1_i1.p1  ORF type:complete len:825 (-),score=99.29 TRINITY_DN45715_c0_g1_i1:190-2664(-)